MKPKPAVEPVLLRVPEVAQLLSISAAKTYDLINRGELPGVIRLGGSIRIHRATLLAWLAGEADLERMSSPLKWALA